MKKVVVLMSTYNGEKYLVEQIDSILNQKDIIVKLLIRDDGSSDTTLNLLDNYSTNPNVSIIKGENLGYTKSFLSLLYQANKADYYAFADQDDIWDNNKIASAISIIEKNNVLYASNLRVVDENKSFIGIKKFKNYRVNLGSQISRNRLSGCTMVFSYEIKHKMDKIIPKILDNSYIKYSHDGWVLINHIISGGSIYVDDNAYISYRRHSNSVTLINKGILARIKSEFKIAFIKNERQKIVDFILNNCDIINNDDFILLNDIKMYRNSFKIRLKLLFCKNINTGIKIIDILNRFAIIMGKY
jgi:rhamnosyltransferase